MVKAEVLTEHWLYNFLDARYQTCHIPYLVIDPLHPYRTLTHPIQPIYYTNSFNHLRLSTARMYIKYLWILSLLLFRDTTLLKQDVPFSWHACKFTRLWIKPDMCDMNHIVRRRYLGSSIIS